jgi:hypothetical protein
MHCRSQWPRGLRRVSAASRFLGLMVQIPLGACMSLSCECCKFSSRCLCHSSRGVPLSVVCLSVIMNPRQWGSLGLLGAGGPWFKTHLGHECLSLVSVVRFRVDVSATRTEESHWVWCVWVWSWILDNEEALAYWGLVGHGKEKYYALYRKKNR